MEEEIMRKQERDMKAVQNFMTSFADMAKGIANQINEKK